MLTCEQCNGVGHVKDKVSLALQAFRVLESNIINAKEGDAFVLTLPIASAFVLFNHKRRQLTKLEEAYKIQININLDERLIGSEFKLTQNEKEIKGFYRPLKKQTQKSKNVMHKAPQTSKVKPIEMYDLQDEALAENYSTPETTQEEPRSQQNNNRKRRYNHYDRRNNNQRNRNFSKEPKDDKRQPAKIATGGPEKTPWWKRLFKG